MLDYYHGVVLNYIRADRALFVNTEFCIQINEGINPSTSGPHWYSDVLVADLRSKTVFLGEITYAAIPATLITRLAGWNKHWPEVGRAIRRDAHIPADWEIRPWLFVPEKSVGWLVRKLGVARNERLAFSPRITTLEMTQPWNYRGWDRQSEAQKPDSIPAHMQL